MELVDMMQEFVNTEEGFQFKGAIQRSTNTEMTVVRAQKIIFLRAAPHDFFLQSRDELTA
jgi:hypothetical protein